MNIIRKLYKVLSLMPLIWLASLSILILIVYIHNGFITNDLENIDHFLFKMCYAITLILLFISISSMVIWIPLFVLSFIFKKIKLSLLFYILFFIGAIIEVYLLYCEGCSIDFVGWLL
jgi:hypothetical protein